MKADPRKRKTKSGARPKAKKEKGAVKRSSLSRAHGTSGGGGRSPVNDQPESPTRKHRQPLEPAPLFPEDRTGAEEGVEGLPSEREAS
jgi:hypothetical protein